MRKVYLAGPEVFDTNAVEIGEKLVKLCKTQNLEGLYPLDNIIKGNSPQELSRKIFMANKEMIERSDFVIANINSWRGQEPDSGTVWEIGYALGLGKQVFGYLDMPEISYLDRMPEGEVRESKEVKNQLLDLNNKIVEDFQNPVNLMIAESIVICETFEECMIKATQI